MQKTNIAFFNMNYPFSSRPFADSVRKFMPDSEFIQLSDPSTKEIPEGVDKFIIHETPLKVDPSTIHYYGYKWLSELDVTNLIHLDMDMVLNGNIDDVFNDDFDVAVCKRGLGQGMKTFIVENYPYCSLTITKTTEFWKDCYERILSYGKLHWDDGMISKRDVIWSGKYKVKILDSRIFNNIPRYVDRYDPEAKVFHFKSNKKNDPKFFMEEFYDTHIRNK